MDAEAIKMAARIYDASLRNSAAILAAAQFAKTDSTDPKQLLKLYEDFYLQIVPQEPGRGQRHRPFGEITP